MSRIDIFKLKGALFHDTPYQNLESILKYGILSRLVRELRGIKAVEDYPPLVQNNLGRWWISVFDWWGYYEREWKERKKYWKKLWKSSPELRRKYPSLKQCIKRRRNEILRWGKFEKFMEHKLRSLFSCVGSGKVLLVIDPSVEKVRMYEEKEYKKVYEEACLNGYEPWRWWDRIPYEDEALVKGLIPPEKIIGIVVEAKLNVETAKNKKLKERQTEIAEVAKRVVEICKKFNKPVFDIKGKILWAPPSLDR